MAEGTAKVVETEGGTGELGAIGEPVVSFGFLVAEVVEDGPVNSLVAGAGREADLAPGRRPNWGMAEEVCTNLSRASRGTRRKLPKAVIPGSDPPVDCAGWPPPDTPS